MQLNHILAVLALALPAAAQSTPAEYPFYDGFEGAELGASWSTSGDGFPRWSLTGEDEPHAGAQHVLVGSEVAPGFVKSSLSLRIDLSGRNNVLLDFMLKRRSYQVLSEEGLYLSENGKDFLKAFEPDFLDVDLDYTRYLFDLDELAAGLGLDYTKDFSIRYVWVGYDGDLDDGVYMDEFRVGPAGFSTLGVIEPVVATGLGNFGSSLAPVGDLDADGVGDLAIGYPGYSLKRGRVEVFSGATLQALSFVQKGIFGERMGEALANVGDLDGDGFDELLVGAPSNDVKATDAGAAYLVSPKLGTVLHDFNGAEAGAALGTRVASAGDLDGDGLQELLVAAPDADGVGGEDSGRVRLYRGSDRSLWRTFEGAGLGHRLGAAMVAGADLDGDGVGELLFGAPGWSAGAGAPVGATLIFSGATGLQLGLIPGVSEDGGEGSSLAALPDVDQDGIGDLAVGAPMAAAGRGWARVLSGASGEELARYTGLLPAEHLGASLALVGDLDGFELEDLAIGSDTLDAGVVVFVELPGLEVLRRASVIEADTGFGRSLVGVGDISGDGFADVLVGEPSFDTPGSQDVGRVRVVSTVAVPELDEIQGLHCTLSGDVILRGTNLTEGMLVQVDGQTQALTPVSPFEARLPMGPDIPGGFYDLTLTTGLGTLTVPDGVVRFPALDVDAEVPLQGDLTVRFENGTDGVYVLAWSNQVYGAPAPFEALGWYHGLELNGVWTAAVGTLTPGDTYREHLLKAPSQPIFIGSSFYLQCWSYQADLGLAGFSNMARTTILP